MYKTYFYLKLLLVLLSLGYFSPLSAADNQQPERVHEISLDAKKWRDTAQGIEYCEGIFKYYYGRDNDPRCRVSVGGLSGFIGTMRDGYTLPLEDALVLLSGKSIEQYQAKVIRTHVKAGRGLGVTYSLVERTDIEDAAKTDGIFEINPVVANESEQGGWGGYLLAFGGLGFGVLTLFLGFSTGSSSRRSQYEMPIVPITPTNRSSVAEARIPEPLTLAQTEPKPDISSNPSANAPSVRRRIVLD